MKGTRITLCALFLAAWSVQAPARGLVTRVTAYAGAATWLTGTTLGLISKNKANAIYDDYLMAADSDSAKLLYKDYEANVDDANTFLIVGYSGLGLCAACYLIDRARTGRWASLQPAYDGHAYRLAWAIEY